MIYDLARGALIGALIAIAIVIVNNYLQLNVLF